MGHRDGASVSVAYCLESRQPEETTELWTRARHHDSRRNGPGLGRGSHGPSRAGFRGNLNVSLWPGPLRVRLTQPEPGPAGRGTGRNEPGPSRRPRPMTPSRVVTRPCLAFSPSAGRVAAAFNESQRPARPGPPRSAMPVSLSLPESVTASEPQASGYSPVALGPSVAVTARSERPSPGPQPASRTRRTAGEVRP